MDKTIYITNIPRGVSNKELSKIFMRYGAIKSIRVKHRYAFVEFVNEKSADDAIRDNYILYRRTNLVVNKARSMKYHEYKNKRRTPYRLIVKNLSSRATWRDLKNYMVRAGGVVLYADVTRLHEGYVEYETYEQMEKAFNELNNTVFKGLSLKLIIDYRPDDESD